MKKDLTSEHLIESEHWDVHRLKNGDERKYEWGFSRASAALSGFILGEAMTEFTSRKTQLYHLIETKNKLRELGVPSARVQLYFNRGEMDATSTLKALIEDYNDLKKATPYKLAKREGLDPLHNETPFYITLYADYDELKKVSSMVAEQGFKQGLDRDRREEPSTKTAEDVIANGSWVLQPLLNRRQKAHYPSAKENAACLILTGTEAEESFKKKDLMDHEDELRFLLKVRDTLRDMGYSSATIKVDSSRWAGKSDTDQTINSMEELLKSDAYKAADQHARRSGRNELSLTLYFDNDEIAHSASGPHVHRFRPIDISEEELLARENLVRARDATPPNTNIIDRAKSSVLKGPFNRFSKN